MGKRQHPFTPYFIISEEKANSTHRFAICRSCKRAYPNKEESELKFVNKKTTCKNHLRNCEVFHNEVTPEEYERILNLDSKFVQPLDYEDDGENSCSSSQSQISLPLKISKKQKLNNLTTQPIYKYDQDQFNQSILYATISTGVAFRWVNDIHVKKAFAIANPTIKLPNRINLAGKILDNEKKSVQDHLMSVAEADEQGVTLAFDGWKNIIKQNILGVVLITSSGKPLIWKAEDISGNLQNWQTIYKYVIEFFEEAKNNNIKIIALVTDSASENAAARKRLQKNIRDKVFLPCFAHQSNLCVGDIFKISSQFMKTSKIYGKYIALMMPNDTRWNSHYYCFKSILKTKIALKSKEIPSEICETINNEQWWHDLQNLETLIYPFCAILNKLQRDKAQLHDVLHGFGYLMKVIKQQETSDFQTKMIEKLERRWKQWEQPLLLISFLLNPTYRLTKFNKNISTLNLVILGKWIIYYYMAWFDEKPLKILSELNDWFDKKYPFDDESFDNFDKDIIKYWKFVSRGRASELANIALRIYSICVNSASVERLFSTMGFFHTKRRNKLKHSKVLAMCQIRAKIYQDEINANIDYARECFYSNSILNNQLDEMEIENLEETIQYWIELLDDDTDLYEIEENNNDNILNSLLTIFVENLDDNSCTQVNNLEHPAEDNLAKWNLYDLFVSDLEIPDYFNML
ncbi:22777_t:CDS:2 [Cetraspora pellucida]|uniref:22777_t:CDS:1 n=1 Tax=Cetraspora pellucida TaxID=1433469 RepID=A0A9N9K2G8_9GLOM|nr:22777_t:CDS:2 [Cetraspora pellucida]